jgi:hypothetical protein
MRVLSALASAPQSHKNDYPLSNGYKTQTSPIKSRTTYISQFLTFNAVIKQKEKRKWVHASLRHCFFSPLSFGWHPWRLEKPWGKWTRFATLSASTIAQAIVATMDSWPLFARRSAKMNASPPNMWSTRI